MAGKAVATSQLVLLAWDGIAAVPIVGVQRNWGSRLRLTSSIFDGPLFVAMNRRIVYQTDAAT
jgi:hypothetical protein